MNGALSTAPRAGHFPRRAANRRVRFLMVHRYDVHPNLRRAEIAAGRRITTCVQPRHTPAVRTG